MTLKKGIGCREDERGERRALEALFMTVAGAILSLSYG
jgi:hypothetical protein